MTTSHRSRSLTVLSLTLMLALGGSAAGCSSPLASRRAQVMQPGELEIVAVPYVEATALIGAPTLPVAYPFGEAAVRFGLVDRLDIQLKVDPTVIPEVSLGYQLVGDPEKNELAFTITAGVKPTVVFLPLVATGGLITTPVQAIVDVPIGDTATLVAGVRVIPALLFATSIGGGGGSAVTVAPGVFGALHFGFPSDAGDFFFRPELAMNGLVPLFAASGLSATPLLAPQLGTINVAAGLGFGGTFSLGKKGAPVAPVAPAPVAPAPDAPVPAPVAPVPAPVAPADPSDA